LWIACVELLAIGMGIGKASVYKYIPAYFPRDVGAVGGLVGSLGALGGFVLPLGFGYLQQATAQPRSCFWLLLTLIAWSFAWLHLVVAGIKRTRAQDVPPATRAAT
jgi:NNP family nitrate/nitrite transporter-like MFS transporter